ncbi:MAG: hypothetical protein K6D97_03220 [Clostridia bacterium]|nr:hypothetical protein [Clostridia bacterium]
MDSVTKDDLKKKLKYLDLDLNKIQDELISYEPLNFSISRLNNDRDHRVFKYISIDKIDILVTPCLRTDPLKEKYSKALPLYKYIVPSKNEDDLERYTTFLKMLNKVTIPEIENIVSLQKEVSEKEPFRVTYNKDHLWQIYYSESVDRYFMLVCTKEETYAEFFYLLKEKISYIKSNGLDIPKIYVPVNALNYSEAYLNRTEIADLENYLWLFTKNWALTFDVYNVKNKFSMQIVGETTVYDKVKSTYKIILANKDETIRFYKLLKALFIMQTEIKDHFKFSTKIDSNNSLELYFGKVRVTYDMLTEFIRNEVEIAREEIDIKNEDIVNIEKKLGEIKIAVRKNEEEYLVKQREISTFLEYKKTFIGKVKYFFKPPKSSKKLKSKDRVQGKIEREIEDFVDANKDKFVEDKSVDYSFIEKKYYTIEDLVVIYSILEKVEKNYQDVQQDLKAQKLKLENIISKVKNATLYIEEIDKHRKSIFDFWKYSNKDEKLSLEMGNEFDDEERNSSLKKSFDIEYDMEELGQKVDGIQRKKLSREETDSVFLANTEVLPLINMLRENNLNQRAIERCLERLKEQFQNNRLLIESETFDIFGNVADDSTKLKYIGSKSHRENEKSKFKILNINKKIDSFDFTEKLQSVGNYLDGAIPKNSAEYDFTLYKVCQITEEINENYFDVFNLDVEKALKEYEDDGEGALNLIKLNYKEGLPLLYYSNIIFFDNMNQTLPQGMDVSSRVLIDCKKLDFKLVSKEKFRTNNYFTESNNLIFPKAKDVFVYEYDVDIKR